jgi:hypothetical protein
MLISPQVAPAGQRPPRLSFSRSLNAQASDGFAYSSVEEKVKGLTFKDALKVARPETDRVTTSDRVNPASDALLLNLIDKLPVDLAKMTWGAVTRFFTQGSSTPPALRQSVANYEIGKEEPIEHEALLDTLSSVMKEFPEFRPHLGPEHVWSKDGKSYQGLGYYRRVGQAIAGQRPFPFPTFSRSKLICALGLGATNLVMPTGTEPALKAWILQQPPGSVEFHQLFREAYRLNEGDLYGTLLSAENVLCEGLYDPDRQKREVTSRLSYLRSDSSPQGDNFGSWYHLFGSALYSLMRPEWKARTAMAVEGAGSLILEGSDPQEDHINRLGVRLGAGLRDLVQNGLPESPPARPYLNTREFGWDRRSVATWSVPSPEGKPA